MQFILSALLMILVGLFVRRYWIILLLIWYSLQAIVGIVISSWITALILTMLNFLTNGNVWEGFNTYWMYSAVFFVVGSIVYVCIWVDIFTAIGNLISSLSKK